MKHISMHHHFCIGIKLLLCNQTSGRGSQLGRTYVVDKLKDNNYTKLRNFASRNCVLNVLCTKGGHEGGTH